MSIADRIDLATFSAKQVGLFAGGLLLEKGSRALALTMGVERASPPSSAVKSILRDRVRKLLDQDKDNVAKGIYPISLLAQTTLLDHAKHLPEFLVDAPSILRRAKDNHYKDLPKIDLEKYPPYYRRCFHWQSGGYLSERSARIYDLSVELLFKGMADVMRRQALRPIKRHLQTLGTSKAPDILDLGCGTGLPLDQMCFAFPEANFSAIDLSPPYLERAKKRLPQVEFTQGAAEELPYESASIDVVSSTYLFHELPRAVRRKVLAEALRVLRPGGLLVLCDSTQLADSEALAEVLGAFAKSFHEPFYKDYLRDDLAALVSESGFAFQSAETHLVSRLVVAQKPS